MKTIITLLLLTLISCSHSGKIIRVIDGDTIIVLNENNTTTRLRLAEVDCPESNQNMGQEAKYFTQSQVLGKNVTYKVVNNDKYGRSISKVYYNDKYLSEQIIKTGNGWWYKRYSTDLNLKEEERNAKNKSIGLWRFKNPINPYTWRTENPKY